MRRGIIIGRLRHFSQWEKESFKKGVKPIKRRGVTSRYHGSKGSLSNDEGDGNENGKKGIGLY